MDTITLSVEDVRELNRSIFTLYKYFSEVMSNVSAPDGRSRSPTEELAFISRPWLSYSFKSGSVTISIHRLRDGSFTLECLGIVLTHVKPFSAHEYRYRNYYGHYEDLTSAITAYNSAVKSFVTSANGELF